MQKRVDDYYAAFTRSVARGRRVSVDVVRGGMGRGRMLGADAALEAGLVDGVSTFDEVVRRMRSDRSAGAAKASALMGRVASTQPLPNLARARRELELLILEGSPVPK